MYLNTSMRSKRPVSSRLSGPQPPALTGGYDSMLVNIAENKDKQSFIELYEHFAPRVKSFLMKGGLPESQADELAQETMLTVWDKAALFNPVKASASTWIFTLARNKKIDQLRRRIFQETPSDALDLLETPDDSAEQSMMDSEAVEALAEAMDSLPEDQVDLLKKSFFENKSHGDIARETGLPLGTIKSRIRLALQRLRGHEKMRVLW